MALSARTNDLSSSLRHILQQPAAVSAIASFGTHVLLFVLLPVLPYAALTDPEPEIREPVEVIELTPEEQSRLPDLSSPVELPPLFQDSFPDTALVPLPLPDQNTAPPPPSGFFSQPLFPSFPDFSSLTPAPPRSVTIVPATPPVRPSTPASPTEPTTPRTQPSEEGQGLPTLDGAERQPNLNNGEEDVATNSETGSTETSPSTSPTDTQQQVPPTRTNEEIIAGLRQDVEARRRQLQVQQQLSYDPSGTADDPNYNRGLSWAAWMERLQAYDVNLSNVNPEDNRFPEVKIQDLFPPEACGYVQETISADYGVVIDADGKPIADTLVVLRSSGRALFNNQGAIAITESTFKNEAGSNVPYSVTVEFPYTGESCSGRESGGESTVSSSSPNSQSPTRPQTN